MTENGATTLIYGAYGYTGELVARRAIDAGMEPVLAGRREAPLRGLARELDLEYRAFDLADPVAPHLDDVAAVAHCAGPFVDTYRPMVDACLATDTHYVDITGEISVLEAIKQYDDLAAEAGLMFLPGAGFDVVPSDCLAAHLDGRLPDAHQLRLVLDTSEMDASAGTLKTMVEGLGEGTAVREQGRIVTLALGQRTRTLDTGRGPQRMTAIPWGDVSTAHYSTGIENVEVYVPVSDGSLRVMGVLNVCSPVLGSGPVRRMLQWAVDRLVEGPDEQTRESGSAAVWGEVRRGSQSVRARVTTPESYRFTAESVVEVLTRIQSGDVHPGYQTPSTAYGEEFVLAIDGCSVEDLD